MTQLSISPNDISSVQEMTGLDADSARRGLEKYGSIEALANAFLDGNFELSSNSAELPQVPPGTPSTDVPNPGFGATFGPSNYIESSEPVPSYDSSVALPYARPPGSPPSSHLIDLTGDDTSHPIGNSAVGPSNDPDDDELQKALKMSTEQDSDLSKALELSMSDLREAPSANPVDAVNPVDRVRIDETPVALRSDSPLLSALASFLQCLYAVPTWRKAVFDYRPSPTRGDSASRVGYADYWKGASRDPSNGTSINDREGHWGVFALQRLFVFMHESRRSFTNVTEITQIFGHEVTDEITRTGGDQASALRALYQSLVQCIVQARRNHYAQQIGAQKLAEAEARARLTADINRFSYTGHEIMSKYIAAPLPPLDLDDKSSTEVTSLRVKAFGSAPEDLYGAIDATFLPAGVEGDYNLLATVPETLVFKIERHVEQVVDLDSFGSNHKRQLFRPLETIYLDRYHARNRRRIYEGRAKVHELQGRLQHLHDARDRLATTKDGKSGVDLLNSSIKYLAMAKSEDEARHDRQRRLAKQYTAVLAEMQRKIAEYEQQVKDVSNEIHAVFEADDMRRVGPYELRSILMRNGLNGRGSSWAVVKGDDGRWWRSSDMTMEPVSLEDALGDTSGLHMNAGATMLFYQHSGFAPSEPLDMPQVLKDQVLVDNHAFAHELPPDVTLSWNLPPAPEPDSPQLMHAAPDEEPLEVIPLPLENPPSPTPVDLPLSANEDDELMQVEALASPITPDRLAPSLDTKMSFQEPEMQHVENVTGDNEPLRLRGGADDAEMNEDQSEDGAASEHGSFDNDDDEDIDEDEVELGLLEPMPATWDIDFAVGKVGGLPIYLDPTSTLSPKDVECEVCHSVMALLLQVNSPDDERAHAAARALYLFACRTKDCVAHHGSKAMRLWRSQMPSPNAFYPHTEETQARRVQLETALARNAGLSSAPSSTPETWPEWDIVAESEPYEESYLPDTAPQGEREEGTEDAAEPDTKTGVDRAFLTFQERIERVPEQVLRFYRLPDVLDPQPLWANAHQISEEDVPLCPLCRGPRKIEFQVVSTLLNFIKDDNVSFDSLLVYTCIDNCPIPERASGEAGWAQEVVVDQAFAAEGVRFNLGPASGP